MKWHIPVETREQIRSLTEETLREVMHFGVGLYPLRLTVRTSGVYPRDMKTMTTTTRKTTGYQRRNFTLQADTASKLDRLPRTVNRSRLVDEAIQERLAVLARTRLRKQLEQGYALRSASNLGTAEEWFGLEEEAWETATKANQK